MKILFVSTYFPNDLHTYVHGVYKRMNMFIDAMKEIAHLDILFYVPPDLDISPNALSELERSFSEHWNTEINLFLCPKLNYDHNNRKFKKWFNYGGGAISIFRQSNFFITSGPQQVKAFESCLQKKPDVIFAHKLGSVIPLLRTNKTLPPVFFDLDDIEHVTLKRRIAQLTKWKEKVLCYAQLPALLLGELRAIHLAHKTFVCSETDRRYLADRWRQQGVVTAPNAVKIPEQQPLTHEPTMLFIGSYRYKPNIDAVEFLIRKVWPRVHRIMPSATLIIAGANPERIHGHDLNIPGVTFIGFVHDLDDLYRKIKIVSVPILAGGGTRLKIIEAAAYGKPVVSTKIGAEGIEMRDGHELLLRDDPGSFAEACLMLLRDSPLCEKFGSAAREKVLSMYDRKNILSLIQKHLKVA